MAKKRISRDTPNTDPSFRDSVGGVRPVKARRQHLQPPKPKPHARFSRDDDASVLAESLLDDPDTTQIETGEELLFYRPNVTRPTLRRLRRGNFAIQDEIDLHGMTVAEAQPALRAFIKECRRARYRCVRVVHGKGRGSGPKGPVLKSGVNRWLSRWEEVAAFCSAQPRDGGHGAAYVLLYK
jgi:DNA-nicking Smr family endonuclease